MLFVFYIVGTLVLPPLAARPHQSEQLQWGEQATNTAGPAVASCSARCGCCDARRRPRAETRRSGRSCTHDGPSRLAPQVRRDRPEHQHDRAARVRLDAGARRDLALRPDPDPRRPDRRRRGHGGPARADPRLDGRLRRGHHDHAARLHGHGHERRDLLGRRRGQPAVRPADQGPLRRPGRRHRRRGLRAGAAPVRREEDRRRHAVHPDRRRERPQVLHRARLRGRRRSRASAARPRSRSPTSASGRCASR